MCLNCQSKIRNPQSQILRSLCFLISKTFRFRTLMCLNCQSAIRNPQSEIT